MPDTYAGAVHDEVAASIEHTLRREARRNELIIAAVRMGLLAALSMVEIIFALEPGGVDFVQRVPTFVFFAVSIVLYFILRRGVYHPALAVGVPLLDGALIFTRMHATFSFHPLEVLQDGMELTTVLGGAALLIITGAFRLRRLALVPTALYGLVLYLYFAVYAELMVEQMTVHVALLGAVAGMSWGLTVQVRRAVKSEVARMTLARFLPASVVDEMHADPLALLTQPRSVDATVLISDIRGFTTWAEQKTPIEVLGFLNVVQGALAETVREHQGTVDKFMGDGMLAVFGAPEDLEHHAVRALQAARKMQIEVARINAETDGADVKIGIGIHSGELVVGCLGSGVRMEFTVLGDTVNTSSRLESMTKQQGVDVLISEDTLARLPGSDGLAEVGEVAIRGRDKPMTVWTLG